MSLILPINIQNLLTCNGVESPRVEFKGSWDEKTTGYQVIKTICAFANDLQNLNGGYIVLGVEEENGRAKFPLKGLTPEKMDPIQKWVRGHCNQIDPKYQPVFSPEVVNEQPILVIWVPASDTRPHRAPDHEKADKKFFVRIGSESVDAEKNGVLDQLLQLTARVPFDDRRALSARTEDLRENKVREYLRNVGSGLIDEPNTKELYRKLRIAVPVNGHDVPKNIGLLMFSDDPDRPDAPWFPGAHIEVVQFAGSESGNVIEEKFFRGGIHEQTQDALRYMEGISSAHIEKQSTSFQVKGWISYPIPALRESLVNAIYHRSYEGVPEPVKIYFYPDRIEIISYPGPVPGIQKEHLTQGSTIPPVPARNRRIGEFLKELKLAEGRGTGLPKLYKTMRENGSPDPRFDFDDDRTYFRVTLPAHPEYVAISAMRDAAHLRAIGSETDAFKRIEETWKLMPASPTLTAELIKLLGYQGKSGHAETVFNLFRESASISFIPFVTNALIDVLLDAGRHEAAGKLIETLPQYLEKNDAIEAAIRARRLGRQELAHRYFEKAGDTVWHDSRALHEFAQTKIKLAKKIMDQNVKKMDRETHRRLLLEAKELLERVVQTDSDRIRKGWAWFNLATVKKNLKYPSQEVTEAYTQAATLVPEEQRFNDGLTKWAENH